MSEIPHIWRLEQVRYNLVGEICPSCETKMFPPRDICIGCGSGVKATKGEIYEAVRSSFSSPKEASKFAR